MRELLINIFGLYGRLLVLFLGLIFTVVLFYTAKKVYRETSSVTLSWKHFTALCGLTGMFIWFAFKLNTPVGDFAIFSIFLLLTGVTLIGMQKSPILNWKGILFGILFGVAILLFPVIITTVCFWLYYGY